MGSGTSMCRQHCRTLVDGLDGKKELSKAGYIAHFANMAIDDHSKHRKMQYAHMLRYLWLPSDKKGLSALDKDPLLWCSGGRKHPPLLDAINGVLDSTAIEEKVAERFFAALVCGQAWAMQIL